jgi:hypothetical protein
VGRFSREVLGCGTGDDIGAFKLRDGYHCLVPERDVAACRFFEAAPLLMDRLFHDLEDLAAELASAVIGRDGPYIAAVGELSWLVAQSDYCYAACQLSARRKRYVLAQPVYYILRNLDLRPLSIHVLPLEGRSFEALSRLDLASAKPVILNPGDHRGINGFEEVVWLEESGVALGSISTLPLGAYEATFDAVTGERIGLFSTEMRISSVEVVLRTFAAAGWASATDIAGVSATHSLRELRWAALNYVWRCDTPDLLGVLHQFAGDADPQIAALAGSCLSAALADQSAA